MFQRPPRLQSQGRPTATCTKTPGPGKSTASAAPTVIAKNRSPDTSNTPCHPVTSAFPTPARQGLKGAGWCNNSASLKNSKKWRMPEAQGKRKRKKKASGVLPFQALPGFFFVLNPLCSSFPGSSTKPDYKQVLKTMAAKSKRLFQDFFFPS